MLRIALPKGRIAKETLEIFEAIFGHKFDFEDRKLILKVGDFEFLLVRNQDVPTYVYNGAADLGVVGLDVLKEREFDIMHVLDLGIGKCNICIGIPKGTTLDLSSPEITVATKLENIAKNYFTSKSINAKIIKLNGSIELAPLIGLSDAIVDIVETGITMEQNGLKVDREIMTSTAHLIANQNSFIQKKKDILALSQKIKIYLKDKK